MDENIYAKNRRKYDGVRFYCLTVKGEPDENDKIQCVCDCGKTVTVDLQEFDKGAKRKCSPKCKKRQTSEYKQIARSLANRRQGMKQRCYNKNGIHYGKYGGRGITICEDWMRSLPLFVDWGMKNGFSEGLSIDRIDVNGNYEPSNCRWATRKEQANNKGDTRMIFGQPLTPFCEEHGLNTRQVRYRLNVGDSDESAVFRARRQKDCPALETWCEREITNIQNMTGDEISKYFLEV